MKDEFHIDLERLKSKMDELTTPFNDRRKHVDALEQLGNDVLYLVKETRCKDDSKARERYAAFLKEAEKNVNGNRFPAWWELSPQEQDKYR